MQNNKIIPCFWYNADRGKLSNLIQYYKTIFGDNFGGGNIMPLGDTPSGYSEMSEIQLFGQKYLLMSSAKLHHSLNDSSALMINCADQAEIDKYWNYFTKEGKESQCGWCVDKYGLRWQIIPVNFGELMQKPNAWKIMMGQKKIVIAEYLE